MLPVFHNNTCGRRPLHCGISAGPMSLRGQTRSFGDVGSMYGLPESGHGGPESFFACRNFSNPPATEKCLSTIAEEKVLGGKK
jgi:hypothetical protein